MTDDPHVARSLLNLRMTEAATLMTFQGRAAVSEVLLDAKARIEALEAHVARLTVVDPVRTSVIEWQGNEWRTVTYTQWRPV